MKAISFFLKLIFISGFISLLGLLFIFFRYDYDSFINVVAELYGKEERILIIRNSFFPYNKFLFARFLLIALFIIWTLIGFTALKKIDKLSRPFANFFSGIKNVISGMRNEIFNLNVYEKGILFFIIVLLVVSRLFYALKYPLNTDELFSYLYLVDKGFFVCASYYPGPNNHIFFSEICSLIGLFSDNPKLVMRIPALVFGMMNAIVLFVITQRFFSYWIALFATVIFSFSYNVFYYSMHGRGYIVLIFFVLINLYSFWRILFEKKNRATYIKVFILSGILGFYTIPVFLYPFSACFLFALIHLGVRDKKKIFNFIIINIFVVTGVLILYSPVLFFSGLDSIVGNNYVKSFSYPEFWKNLGRYLINLNDYFWNVETLGVYFTLFSVLIGTFLLSRKNKFLSVLLIACFVVPLIMIVMQRVLPFFRVWDYFWIYFSIYAGLILYSLISYLKKDNLRMITSISVIFLIISWGGYQVEMVVGRGFRYYEQMNQFLDHALKEKNIESALVYEDTYFLFMRYRIEKGKAAIKLYSSASDGMPDLIVLPQNTTFPEGIDPEKYDPYLSNVRIISFKKTLGTN